MRLQILLLTAFSLISCKSLPERPDTDLCILNAEAENRKCFNMKDDYDDNGHLLPNAVAEYRANASLGSINKSLIIDSDKSMENLKIYLQELRDALKSCNQNQSNETTDGPWLTDELQLK